MTILLILFSFLAAANPVEEARGIMEKHYPSAEIKKEIIRIPGDLKNETEKKFGQKFFADELYVFSVIENGVVTARGILDNVYGKSLPITFLVIFDKNGIITKTEIVKYREQYGGEVRGKSWLHRLTGRSAEKGFSPDKDIQAITGATISSRSVARGVGKLVWLYDKLF